MDELTENKESAGKRNSNLKRDQHISLIRMLVNGGIKYKIQGEKIPFEQPEMLLKEALENILNENRKYSKLFYTAPAGYIVLTENLKIQEANQMTGLWLQHETSQLNGIGFTDFIHPEYHETFLFFIKNLKAGKTDSCQLKLRNDSALVSFHGTTGLEEKIEDQSYRILFFKTTDDMNFKEVLQKNVQNKKEVNKAKEPDEAPLKKLNILVADDDEVARLYFNQLLNGKCREILFAKNGKEAVDIFQANPTIDLIFMDIKMPVLDGYSATIKIKEQNKKVVVVAQTAYALASDRQKALAAGCDDYLAKPLMKKDLFSVIEKFFN